MWRREADRLARLINDIPSTGTTDDAAVATVVSLARPGWIARSRGGGLHVVFTGLRHGGRLTSQLPVRTARAAVASGGAHFPSYRWRSHPGRCPARGVGCFGVWCGDVDE